MKTVTAVRAAGPGSVHVDLDGERWRTIPLEAAMRARLAHGLPLDRERARALGRELRRLRALRTAANALRHRDRSVAELGVRLERRGIAAADRNRTLETLTRAGLVDDERLAGRRAASLAERGSGDALIRDELERRGIASGTIEVALASLEPEHARAERIASGRGRSAKTARFLAARGFDGDAVASVVAHDVLGEVE